MPVPRAPSILPAMSPGPAAGAPRGAASTTTASTDTSDWPAQAADTIERVVGSVRDKTTGPAITAARWVVYGTFAAVVGTVVAVFSAIGAVRLLDVYLPDALVGDDHTWLAHLIVGSVFALVGALLWSRRSAAPEPA
jgi:hypothetical protein